MHAKHIVHQVGRLGIYSSAEMAARTVEHFRTIIWRIVCQRHTDHDTDAVCSSLRVAYGGFKERFTGLTGLASRHKPSDPP